MGAWSFQLGRLSRFPKAELAEELAEEGGKGDRHSLRALREVR